MQTKQRGLLSIACDKVRHHDLARSNAVGDIVDAVLKSYR